MSTDGILCSKSHEYVLEKNGLYAIGISDYAVEQLGDIVFVELPEVDATIEKGEPFATVESVKAASEVYMPISGKVVEINETLIENPELVNDDTFGKAWFVKIEPTNLDEEKAELMEYDEYRDFLDKE